MAFPSPPERTFERLSCVVHERMQFSTVNISHSLSTVFDGSVYNPRDERRVLGDFEANWEKSCPETSDTSEDVVCDKSFWNERGEQFCLASVNGKVSVGVDSRRC